MAVISGSGSGSAYQQIFPALADGRTGHRHWTDTGTLPRSEAVSQVCLHGELLKLKNSVVVVRKVFCVLCRNWFGIDERGLEKKDMENNTKPMARFYHDLLSVDWEERLQAYSVIEHDLKLRGYYVLNDDRWEDMKLLVGQVVSIHFKKHAPRDLEDFEEKFVEVAEDGE